MTFWSVPDVPASKLWRALGVTDPVFVVERPTGTVNDPAIVSLTLTRGNGAVVGSTTNTATIRLAGAEYPLQIDGAAIDVRLTAAGLAAITGKAGGYAGPPVSAALARRWNGRIAGKKVTDTGDRREAQWVTDLTCADLLPLVSTIDAGAHATKSAPSIPALVEDMLTRSEVNFGGLLIHRGANWANVYFAGSDPTTKTFPVSTVLGHFVGDMGSLLRVRRDGVPELLRYDWRQLAAGLSQSLAPYPLTRSAALTPASWSQRVTVPHGVEWTQQDGWTWNTSTGSTNPDIGRWPVEHLDMQDVELTTGESGSTTPLLDPMNARAYRSGRDGYAIDTLKFDILDLLNRDDPALRRLAVLLLSVEPGDPIGFAENWPYPTRYGEMANVSRVEETITPDAWTVALDTTPITWSTGQPSPEFDYDTWDYGYPKGWSWDSVYKTRWKDATP